MPAYFAFHEDLYNPLFLFRITYRVGKEVAHAIPVPDQVGWLVSGPLVVIPGTIIALAYANGYYLTKGALEVVERGSLFAEDVWDRYLDAVWKRRVPEAYQEKISAVMPELRMGDKIKRKRKEKELEKLKASVEDRGAGEKNEIKDSDESSTFRR